MTITVQVKETILFLFFADTGQSERKSEGTIQFSVTQFIEFPIDEIILNILLLHWVYPSVYRVTQDIISYMI